MHSYVLLAQSVKNWIGRRVLGKTSNTITNTPRRPEPDSSDRRFVGIRHLLRFRNPETCPERANADLNPKSYCVRDGVDFCVRAVCPFRPNTMRRLCVRCSLASADDDNAIKHSRHAISPIHRVIFFNRSAIQFPNRFLFSHK